MQFVAEMWFDKRYVQKVNSVVDLVFRYQSYPSAINVFTIWRSYSDFLIPIQRPFDVENCDYLFTQNSLEMALV